jgi:hypothetical protein
MQEGEREGGIRGHQGFEKPCELSVLLGGMHPINSMTE